MQSRLQSLIESFSNIAIGYGVALIGQIVVFPLFGMQVRLSDNIKIGAIFTVISIARTYTVRRLFNWLHAGQSSGRERTSAGGQARS